MNTFKLPGKSGLQIVWLQGGHPSAIYHQQGGVGHHSMNMGQQQHVEVDVVEGEEEYLEEEEIYDVEGVIDEDENIDFE